MAFGSRLNAWVSKRSGSSSKLPRLLTSGAGIRIWLFGSTFWAVPPKGVAFRDPSLNGLRTQGEVRPPQGAGSAVSPTSHDTLTGACCARWNHPPRARAWGRGGSVDSPGPLGLSRPHVLSARGGRAR